MGGEVSNYKCPACTGPLHYAGSSGKLECDYCGSSYSVDEIDALYGEKLEEAAEHFDDAQETANQENIWDNENGELRTYSCPACGAELICDFTTSATSCPYCGNSSVVPGMFKGGLKPDFIIPFKLDKKAAKEALLNFYKGKKLLPKEFSDKNHIEEIKGVYVPFWLYDGEAYADISYHATRVHSHIHGDERITTTEHYKVRRAGSAVFERVPVDASTKMPDAHMDSIEPFNYADLEEFSTAYLAGYFADKYDVSEADSVERAKTRVANTIESIVNSTAAGYVTCMPEGKSVSVKPKKASYVLLPVWMLSTRWNGNSYLFAMNGQTGKLIGDLPCSKALFWKLFFKISLPLTALITAIMMLA